METTPKEIVKFLDFVRKSTPEDATDYNDAYVKQLQKFMEKVKRSRENILDLLKEIAPVSETLNHRIMFETDIEVLKQMHKLAAKADTMEEFEEAVSNL